MPFFLGASGSVQQISCQCDVGSVLSCLEHEHRPKTPSVTLSTTTQLYSAAPEAILLLWSNIDLAYVKGLCLLHLHYHCNYLEHPSSHRTVSSVGLNTLMGTTSEFTSLISTTVFATIAPDSVSWPCLTDSSIPNPSAPYFS